MAQDTPDNPAAQKEPSNVPAKVKRRRWLKRIALMLFCLALLAYFGGPWVAARLVRSRLQQMIASKLNADLAIGRLSYRFPYGVHVEDATLLTRGPDGQVVELLKIPQLEIDLARHPFHAGPLVISRLRLKDPAIHIIKTQSGISGRTGLFASEGSASADRPFIATRLSDMFELRQFAIQGGQLVFEDRTRPGTVPLVWRNINADIATNPAANPVYTFDMKADNGPLAGLRMAGKLDIDRFDAAIEKLKMTLKVDPGDKQSPAPASLQQILMENKVNGVLTIEGSARLSAHDIEAAEFDLTVSVPSASGHIPALGDEVELGAGIDHPVATIRCTSRAFTPQQELLATALKLRGGHALPPRLIFVSVDNVDAGTGRHVVFLKQAQAVIDSRSRQWELQETKGRILLGSRTRNSGAGFLKEANLFGAVDLTVNGFGGLKHEASGKSDFKLDIHAESPNLSVTSRRLVLTNVACDLALTPDAVEVIDDQKSHKGFKASAFGGGVYANGKLQFAASQQFALMARLDNVDLRQFDAAWTKGGGKPLKLSGRAVASAQFSSAPQPAGQSTLDRFTGRGEFEIVDGRFYEIPVFAKIAAAVKAGGDAATLGRAAALFQIDHQKVHLAQLAVSAPLLGIQGAGDVTLDGKLDLRAVAAPLGDWKKHLQQTKIPIIGDIGAELVGGIQKLLNTATGKVLYQFKITGTADEPALTTEPVPLLSEKGLKLFVYMLKGGDRLLEQLKGL
jgi:hypothetical protein